MAVRLCRKSLQNYTKFTVLSQVKSDGICGLYNINSRTKVTEAKLSTAEYDPKEGPKKINIQLTDDGIFKSGSTLIDAQHTADGKRIYPGKHKYFRLYEGAIVKTGNILCYQKKLYNHPGLNVGIGRDLTLYAYEDGKLYVTWEKWAFLLVDLCIT
ncbi:hypothetical protein CHUAL_007868 [Chamberlinius hualienensis]